MANPYLSTETASRLGAVLGVASFATVYFRLTFEDGTFTLEYLTALPDEWTEVTDSRFYLPENDGEWPASVNVELQVRWPDGTEEVLVSRGGNVLQADGEIEKVDDTLARVYSMPSLFPRTIEGSLTSTSIVFHAETRDENGNAVRQQFSLSFQTGGPLVAADADSDSGSSADPDGDDPEPGDLPITIPPVPEPPPIDPISIPDDFLAAPGRRDGIDLARALDHLRVLHRATHELVETVSREVERLRANVDVGDDRALRERLAREVEALGRGPRGGGRPGRG